jgi:tRNA(Ile2) C34 agmatinyltransferase TiaS
MFVPLGLLAVVVVLLLLRGGRKSAGGVCPHCSAALNFPSHMSEFNCPSCGRRVESRG